MQLILSGLIVEIIISNKANTSSESLPDSLQNALNLLQADKKQRNWRLETKQGLTETWKFGNNFWVSFRACLPDRQA